MIRVLLLLLASALPLAAQITVTPQRIAGMPPADWSNGDGGPAVDALLTPSALAWDRAGNLLIADSRNQSVRRLTPGGAISTVLNQAGVVSMAVDSQGNLYVSVSTNSYTDPAPIYEYSPAGLKSQISNPGSPGSAPALAIDAADNLYITDQLATGGGFVWKRTPSGLVQRIGPAPGVTVYGPHALAFDVSGNLLIADFDGVLRLNADGSLTRLIADVWLGLSKMAPAADGSIYLIGDFYGIWRWSPTAGLAWFAGTQQSGFSDGCALSGGNRVAEYATFNAADLVFDTAGRLYVADNPVDSSDPGWLGSYIAGRVRRIDPDGSIRTVAGSGSMPSESVPGGPALNAIFHNPEALAVDGAGDIFFAESSANHVHEITSAGQFLTVAGTDSPPAGEDPACYVPAGNDVLSSPEGIATDPNGNLYISDTGNNRILRRSADGTITTIARTGVAGTAGHRGPAEQAQAGPTAIAVKADGSVWFVTGNSLRRIGSDGAIESPVAPAGIQSIAVGFDGLLVLSGSQLHKETPGGAFYALRPGVGLVTTDPAGAIYGPLYPLLRVSPNCHVALVTSLQTAIGLYPQGLASDAAGDIYLSADNSIWRIAPIPPPAVDTPSVGLQNPGVFNAASNLTVTVTSGSSFHSSTYQANDSVAGNEILHITGGCMGPLEPAQASIPDGQLPTSVQGTRVLFDGEAAPLLSVQATEILAIAPQDIASKHTVTIAVENQGAQASTVLSVSAAAPGIFVSSGKQAAAINEDGSLNGSDHPAPAGSVVSLYLTGAGVTNPPGVDGALPDLPLPQLALPVSVQVGGVAAEVVYAGSVFGWPGMAQVNVRVPTVAASDAVPVQVTVGGQSRNQAVTIAVR